MNVTSRAVPTLAFMLLAVLASACGVEGGRSDSATATTVASATTVDAPTTTAPMSTTTEPKSTTTEPAAPTTTKPETTTTTEFDIDSVPNEYQEAVLEGMIEAFVEAGMTQEQADCMADSYGRDILDGGDVDLTDQAAMLKYFTDCGVNPLDLDD